MKEFEFMSQSDQIWRNEIITQLAKEARIPIQRAMMTTWSQIDANIYKTFSGREVKMSEILTAAIKRMPCSGRYVFTMSPFPPTIPDELLDPSREFIEKKKRFVFARK